MTFILRRPHWSRILSRLSVIFLTATLTAPVCVAAWGSADDTAGLCDAATRHEEHQSHIPSRLLYAIATVESGRWNKETQASIAWPWTVTAQGEGKFYPNRQDAIRAVRALIHDGVTNIDVGCMQINLGYHPDAFDTLYEAFDPAANVAYAASFLKDLRKDKRSWSRAVLFYHSSDDERQRDYGRRVYTAWRDIRVRDRKARIDEQRKQTAARQARQAQQGEPETATARPSQALTQAITGMVWPPRDYRAQRQAEMNARAWAFSKR